MDAGEFQQPTGVPNSTTSFFNIDSNGNVWECDGTIYEYVFQGLNSDGVPQYSYAPGAFLTFSNPAPFTGVGKAWYDPPTDTLYVLGSTPEHPYGGMFGSDPNCMGQVLGCYTHWSTTQTLSWITSLPYSAVGATMAGQFIFTCGFYPSTPACHR